MVEAIRLFICSLLLAASVIACLSTHGDTAKSRNCLDESDTACRPDGR
jgi:archaellum component FlaG (FlaF/FlaG flagellin family)